MARTIPRRIRACGRRPRSRSTALDGSGARALTTLGLRPANVAWHPNGSTIAFTADENWRTEQMFESPDIYTVSTQGTVARLTNDGYMWSSLAYSPDGQFLLAERTFGTGMIIDQKLSHGGSDDLLLWPTARRRGHQPHREVGPRTERPALVRGWPPCVFHRGEGRHDARVPRGRSRRRAG